MSSPKQGLLSTTRTYGKAMWRYMKSVSRIPLVCSSLKRKSPRHYEKAGTAELVDLLMPAMDKSQKAIANISAGTSTDDGNCTSAVDFKVEPKVSRTNFGSIDSFTVQIEYMNK